MSKIRVSQIEDLTNTIASVATGTSLTAALLDYFTNTGWLGAGAVMATGGSQFIYGQKSYDVSPFVPTGSANLSGSASLLFVKDYVSGVINNYSGWSSGEYVSRSLSQTVAGTKTFSSNVFVPRASDTGHAMNLRDGQIISGVLRSGIDSITVANVLYDGAVANQRITGRHIYDISPYGVTPTHPSGFVTLDYVTGTGLSVGNTVKLTTDQTISGIKTFVNSPIIPIALNANEPIRKSQFDATINLLVAASGTGNFVGVASVNSKSGIVLIEGQGGVSIVECSGIIYVSGNAQNTNLYSVSLPLTSGITGVVFNYATGFSLEPNVVGTLKYAGQGNLQFVDDVILNSTTGGFSVAFSTGIPSTGYYYNFSAIPVSGSSGFLGVKGDRGFPGYNFRQRGQFQIGVQYLPYDVVFTTPNFVSNWTTGTAISDSFNAPSGTGTSLWQILSSGQQGPSGYFNYRAIHNTGTIYYQKDTVVYNDSSYVYTGSIPTSGFTPDALTGGWGLVAAKGALGYLSVTTITGNFTNLSFFLSPVSTGLDLAESFVARSFYFTGFSLGCITTGAGPSNGGLLTGRIYVRDTGNNKIILQDFTFNSGKYHYRSGDFSQPITGEYRLGIDLRNTLSGIDKFSVGIYGFGT